MNPMNGAIPVPGPIIIIGNVGSLYYANNESRISILNFTFIYDEYFFK